MKKVCGSILADTSKVAADVVETVKSEDYRRGSSQSSKSWQCLTREVIKRKITKEYSSQLLIISFCLPVTIDSWVWFLSDLMINTLKYHINFFSDQGSFSLSYFLFYLSQCHPILLSDSMAPRVQLVIESPLLPKLPGFRRTDSGQ